ncbi:putative sporulation protein YtxC [Fuchsiella alkaliacetigena]|uniref:putative sporulation protein YtxC n=1 Tax=Fuchsiella alkaliacetigena TaxID=957042 RepID=UPI00200A8C55|nr:putative sporulation protein YtxC [Fuchsiella alkaliacetigena]MCK8825763.1 putative sporulation protein YtxC [Fuchsiella alkaliacetigena]
MEKVLSIGTALYVEEIREKLNSRIEYLAAEDIKIQVKERQQTEFIFFDYTLVNQEDYSKFKNICKDFLITSLAELIINEVETFLIKELLQEKYQDYSQTEQEIIYNLVLEDFNPLQDDTKKDVGSLVDRKRRIRMKLADYLNFNEELLLEGFIIFRLKDYLKELESRVDWAVDYFIKKQEYQEFIGLLRYFVDIQETKENLVHIIEDAEKGFEVLDDSRQVLKNEYLDSLNSNLTSEKLNYNDLLISALITLMPAEIMLHYQVKGNTFEILRSIFGERVSFCGGCKFCVDSSVKK